MKKNKKRPAAQDADETAADPKRVDFERKTKARALLGKKGFSTVDNLPVMAGLASAEGTFASGSPQKAAAPSGISAAALASAALVWHKEPAKQQQVEDSLSDFYTSGQWDAQKIALQLMTQASMGMDSVLTMRSGSPKDRFYDVARSLVVAAIFGELPSIVGLARAIMPCGELGDEERQAILSIVNMGPSQQLNFEQLRTLVRAICIASGGAELKLSKRTVAIFGQFAKPPRKLKITESRRVLSQKLLKLKKDEACVVVAQKAGTKKGKVVQQKPLLLLRNDMELLTLVDAEGVHDSEGKPDPEQRFVVVDGSEEKAISNFISGQTSYQPNNPLARLLSQSYFVADVPAQAPYEVPVLASAAFCYRF